MSMDNYDRVMNINVRGLVVCMQEQIKLMPARQRGPKAQLWNIASIAGLVGFPEMVAYCASKGAVVQITRAQWLLYVCGGVSTSFSCELLSWWPLVWMFKTWIQRWDRRNEARSGEQKAALCRGASNR